MSRPRSRACVRWKPGCGRSAKSASSGSTRAPAMASRCGPIRATTSRTAARSFDEARRFETYLDVNFRGHPQSGSYSLGSESQLIDSQPRVEEEAHSRLDLTRVSGHVARQEEHIGQAGGTGIGREACCCCWPWWRRRRRWRRGASGGRVRARLPGRAVLRCVHGDAAGAGVHLGHERRREAERRAVQREQPRPRWPSSTPPFESWWPRASRATRCRPAPLPSPRRSASASWP